MLVALEFFGRGKPRLGCEYAKNSVDSSSVVPSVKRGHNEIVDTRSAARRCTADTILKPQICGTWKRGDSRSREKAERTHYATLASASKATLIRNACSMSAQKKCNRICVHGAHLHVRNNMKTGGCLQLDLTFRGILISATRCKYLTVTGPPGGTMMGRNTFDPINHTCKNKF